MKIKTKQELAIMRNAGKILQSVQKLLIKNIKEGVSLIELDTMAEDLIRKEGAEPSFKGYNGFPSTLCTMINSEVVHGIPDKRTLKNGDLLTVDCGVGWNNMHADAAFSVIVGGDDKNPSRAKFSNCVKKALLAGCKTARVGNRLGDIGAVIQETVEKEGYSICKEYTGHGIGYKLHEEPYIYNYGTRGSGPKLEKGMTICIEPIVASGSPKVKILADKWTVVTKDGKDACQWEYCGVVTEKGLEIFA